MQVKCIAAVFYAFVVCCIFLVFIVLKQIGVITWPSLWVFSPLWIGAGMPLITVVFQFLIWIIRDHYE